MENPQQLRDRLSRLSQVLNVPEPRLELRAPETVRNENGALVWGDSYHGVIRLWWWSSELMAHELAHWAQDVTAKTWPISRAALRAKFPVEFGEAENLMASKAAVSVYGPKGSVGNEEELFARVFERVQHHIGG